MKRNGPGASFDAARPDQPGVGRRLWRMLRKNRKYWLIPVVGTLILLALLLILGGSTAAPFIHPLF
ncbi:MAG: DUF5989 family protein [Verrucomicrobiia bacterium]